MPDQQSLVQCGVLGLVTGLLDGASDDRALVEALGLVLVAHDDTWPGRGASGSFSGRVRRVCVR